MASRLAKPPFVLFGYDSSAFTTKVRLALKLRQIPHTFVLVPSMMPRPVLLECFNLTYRKIPVLAIGKEVYIDTSLILEAVASHPAYPPSSAHPALHPNPQHRALARIFASHYTDRPLFRLTCGIMPQAIWESPFGVDRAGLIGHPLDPAKLGAKVSRNLAGLDTYFSILEPLLISRTWVLDTENPSAADIALYYQLDWAIDVSQGKLTDDLTAGNTNLTPTNPNESMLTIFTPDRYPALTSWFDRVRQHFTSLPSVETTRISRTDPSHETKIKQIISNLNTADQPGPVPLLSTPAPQNEELDARTGLIKGAHVSVGPDDTGRDDPTLGTLVGLSTEEVVIVPDMLDQKRPGVEGVRLHFPRVGFVVRPTTKQQKNVRVVVEARQVKL